MGNIEVQNLHTVQAKHRAKGPLQRHATKGKCGPDQPLQGVLHKHDLSVLKDTGTCKPKGVLTTLKRENPGHLKGGMSCCKGELAVLKDATPKDLEEKMQHIEGVTAKVLTATIDTLRQ